MTGIIYNSKVRKVLDHPKTKKYVNKKTIIYFTVAKLFIYAVTAGIVAFHAMDAKAASLEGTAFEVIQIPVSHNTQLEAASTNNEVLHFRFISTNKPVSVRKLTVSTISIFNESSLDNLSLAIGNGTSVIAAKSKNGKVIYDFGKKPVIIPANDSLDFYFIANIKDVDVSYGRMQFVLKKESVVSNSKIAGDFPLKSANYKLKNYDQSSIRLSKTPKTKVSTNTVATSNSTKTSSVTTATTKTTTTVVSSSATLSWPTYYHQINYKFHDVNYPYRYMGEHDGLDLGVSQGSKVMAAADGTVVELANNSNTNYNFIVIRHGDGLATLYGHLSRVDVKLGDLVVRGQLIGLSGGTPGTFGSGKYSNGPHLHFGVAKNGEYVDPQNYLK